MKNILLLATHWFLKQTLIYPIYFLSLLSFINCAVFIAFKKIVAFNLYLIRLLTYFMRVICACLPICDKQLCVFCM